MPRREEDGAQMMLLAAVILLVGLLAIAAMVARVSLLAQETLRETNDPFPDEVVAVEEGVQHAAERLDTLAPGTFLADLEQALAHLAAAEAARGYAVEFPSPPACGAADVVEVRVDLGDGYSRARLVIEAAAPNAC